MPFDTSIDRVRPPLLVALTQFAATSTPPMHRRQIDGCRRDAEFERHRRAGAAFLQHCAKLLRT